MTESSIKTEWKKFADSIGGSINETKATRFNPDNVFRIFGKDVSIGLSWGEEPHIGRGIYVTRQTTFRFKLNDQHNCTLRIHPKDTLSNLITLFTRNKQETEIPELDKNYIFISENKTLVHQVADKLRALLQQTSFKDFVIETKSNSEDHIIYIQVNALIIQKKDLDLFYQFGLHLRDKLD